MKQWVTSGSWTCMFFQILPETFKLFILFHNSWQNETINNCLHPVFWLQCDSSITLAFCHLTRIQFSSIQSLSRVWIFATPWTTAHKASLSITNSRSSLKLMSIESVMPSNHLILCCPLLLLPSVFPSIRVSFQWVSSLHQMVKVLEFQLQHQSFQWIFRVDFLYDWLVGSPCSPRDSQEYTTVQKHQFFGTQLSLSYSHIHTWLLGKP